MSATRTIAGPRRKPRTATTSPFVERLAVALEMDGFPRIAGRIFGLLIISDTDISLDEIASTLGASKASASVNTRMLEDKGFIERVSRPGDRRDYYRIASNLFVKTMEQRLSRWERVREAVGEAMGDSSLCPAARARLRDFDSASGEVRDLLEATLLRLKNRRKR